MSQSHKLTTQEQNIKETSEEAIQLTWARHLLITVRNALFMV
jgi:hypothetical protein